MLCDAVLRFATQSYVILRCVVLCSVLCYVMVRDVAVRYIMRRVGGPLPYVVSRCVVLFYDVLRNGVLCYVVLCHVMLRYDMLCYHMLCYVIYWSMLCCVVSCIVVLC